MEERLEWTGRPSQAINAGSYFACAVAAVKYASARATVYEISTQRLRIHRGFLVRWTEEIELYRVRDTRFERSFLAGLFGVGDVLVISSDSTAPAVIIRAIPDAGRVREGLRNLVEQRRDQKRVGAVEMAIV